MMWNQFVETCTSTNDLALEALSQGASHGTWIAAHTQTSGRGRAGRTWESQKGNLFLSIVLREIPSQVLTWIPLMVAVKIREVLVQLGAQDELLKIKWPNDLLFEGKKLAGILCEGRSQGVVVGLGVNVAHSPDQFLSTSLSEMKIKVGLEDLREQIVSKILEGSETIRKLEVSSIKEKLESSFYLLPGDPIRWDAQGRERRGEVLGLSESGGLEVQCANGSKEVLFAGDVHLLI